MPLSMLLLMTERAVMTPITEKTPMATPVIVRMERSLFVRRAPSAMRITSLKLIDLLSPHPPFGHLLPASGAKGNCWPSSRASEQLLPLVPRKRATVAPRLAQASTCCPRPAQADVCCPSSRVTPLAPRPAHASNCYARAPHARNGCPSPREAGRGWREAPGEGRLTHIAALRSDRAATPKAPARI